MKYSVIIPTYNRVKFLKRAIKSVLNQTIPPYEVIVVDDGSTDSTKELVKKFDVKYIYQKNSGVSSARNLGIKESKGDLIAFLDSDDEWLPNKAKMQLEYHKNGFFFTHTEEIWIRDEVVINQKAHHKKPDGECFYENIDFCKIAPSSVMIERNLFDKVGFFDEELIVCEDYDMWLRVLKRYPVKLVKEALVKKYAGHGDQLSFKYFAMDRYRVKALLKHLPDAKVEAEIKKKLAILEKGAIKHKNSELLEWISKIKEKLSTLS